MIETHIVDERIQERAVLVGLIGGRYENVGSLDELARLADTAGVVVLSTITQKMEKPDSRWYVGKGKVQEVKAELEQLGANSVIFDHELSGAQVRNLEEALDVKIIDRTQLILDIFAQRARTREGILQVELAQLSYLLPRLSGQGKNLSRLGGGIGTRGPGESKLETDRRHIRGRIDELKKQLSEVIRHRTLQRERRKKTGVFQVALVGYTNAGKSTLLRELTKADVFVEDKLFATLDPISRSLVLPGGKEIVVIDTVGFIQNLPHDLVAAFRSTLEEVNEADLLLHVVDSSSELRVEQMRVVEQVLSELGTNDKEKLTVYNKIDQCPSAEAELIPQQGDSMRISAFLEADVERIKLAIEERAVGNRISYRIPVERGDLIALVYRVGEVLDREVEEENLIFHVRADQKQGQSVSSKLAAYEVDQAESRVDQL
jgi:GTP-binding protein HflX